VLDFDMFVSPFEHREEAWLAGISIHIPKKRPLERLI